MNIEDIKKIKKTQLHLHLDGSISLELANKLSKLDFEIIKEKMLAPDKCLSLTDYLTRFSFPISLMQTKENLELIAADLVNRLEEDNVIYAEIRFAPMFHKQQGLSYDDIVSSVLKGLQTNKNIKTNLILCLMRGASEEDNLDTLEVAKRHLNKGVCAIDLAGDEKTYPTNMYKHMFEKANEYGIPYTIHAGEAKDANEVEFAVNIGAKRIGHGIKSIESNDTLKLLKENDILLEVCPTSNIQTNAIDTYSNHPIRDLINNGIKVCINTDNMTVSNITLSEEYYKLHSELNFEKNDFYICNKNAIEASFTNEEEKQKLLQLLRSE